MRRRLYDKLRSLQTDPVPRDAVRMENEPGSTFRVRVGDYRILYRIFYEQQVLLVTKIDKRGRVYE